MKIVFDWIENSKIFKKGMRVGVGVSGGADSMCLLNVLEIESKKIGFDIVAVNIDHSLREKSASESVFVEQYCKKHKIEYIHKRIDVKTIKEENKWTIEQAARVLRYEAFEEIEKKHFLNILCLAHHKDDQAETILMHIFRGSGLKGATGMEFVSRDKLVRPFLNISKQDIMNYVQENDIKFIIDDSNDDEKFTRNYIRKTVLPEIKKVYPSVVDSLCSFAETIRKDEKYISGQVPEDLIAKSKNEIKILQSAVNLPESIFTRLIKRAVELAGVFSDIESKHVYLFKDLFFMKTGAILHLPHGLIAIKDYDGVCLKKDDGKTDVLSKIFGLGTFNYEGNIITTKINNNPTFGVNQYIDYAKIPFDAVFRTKKPGDVFAKLGTGSKKLVDYFTDKKIPQRNRDKILLLCAGSNVLVVLGYDISELAKIDDQTEQIVEIEIKANGGKK